MHNFDQNHTENFEYCKKESAELISLTSTDVANFMRSFYKNKIKSADSFRPARVHKNIPRFIKRSDKPYRKKISVHYFILMENFKRKIKVGDQQME